MCDHFEGEPSMNNTISALSLLRLVQTFLTVSVVAAASGLAAEPVHAAGDAKSRPTVVLVHGAFADSSSWNGVTAALLSQGFPVVAVANPLRGLKSDAAYVAGVVSSIAGDVVLVGHSYGGAVITNAASGRSNVKALVYVAAFAPDANEPIKAVGAKFPTPPLNAALKPDAAGFLYVDTAKVHDVFAADLPREQTRIVAATQKPIIGTAFDESNPGAGWKTIPSWYIVAKSDKSINPDAERFYAKRANAKTTEIESSHVVFLSHPDEVVSVIVEAANGAAKK